MKKKIAPIHPGEILRHDFMEPLGLTLRITIWNPLLMNLKLALPGRSMPRQLFAASLELSV
jgi:hypothetical protein